MHEEYLFNKVVVFNAKISTNLHLNKIYEAQIRELCFLKGRKLNH